MLKFRVAYYILLVILLSKEITGRPLFGFDIFGGYDEESYDDNDTNLTETNGKQYPDWLSSIFDYFYDDDDYYDGDDKYLICKNCTVIVGESQSHTSTQTASFTNQAATTVPTNGQSTTQAFTTISTIGQSSTQTFTMATTNERSSTQAPTTVPNNGTSSIQPVSSGITQPNDSTDGSTPTNR